MTPTPSGLTCPTSAPQPLRLLPLRRLRWVRLLVPMASTPTLLLLTYPQLSLLLLLVLRGATVLPLLLLLLLLLLLWRLLSIRPLLLLLLFIMLPLLLFILPLLLL